MLCSPVFPLSRRSSSSSDRVTALPSGTTRTQHKGYEEVFIPPAIPGITPIEQLIPITDFAPFAQLAFPGVKHLNRIQSKCFQSAYHQNNNLLICAPTGAGTRKRRIQ